MSTNYYVEFNGEKLHVGKSSVGWHFAVRVYPDKQINNLNDWLELLVDIRHSLTDEYDQQVSFTDLVMTITDRCNIYPAQESIASMVGFGLYESVQHFLDVNQAEIGVNGLLRSRIENFAHGGCVGHGKGTWDYFVGDFS